VLDGEGGCRIITPADTSAILCLSPQRRCGEAVLTPPNSNLLFAERAAVPVLRGDLAPGTHLLLSAVWAGNPTPLHRRVVRRPSLAMMLYAS
jgi:hypothetical protein